MMAKRAKILKMLYLYGNHGSICGRHKRESGRDTVVTVVTAHYPGRSDCLPEGYLDRKVGGWAIRMSVREPRFARGHSRSNQRD
jgi:hypothetical protein